MEIFRPNRAEGHIVLGTTVSPLFQREMYKNIEILKFGKRQKTIFSATNHPNIELDLDFLPAASETYQISANPEDYVLVSLPIVTVDIPNRNLQAFPVEEVGHFDSQHGMIVYQTFNRKCCFENHKNDVPAESKGIIVDSSIQYIPKYNIWKINVVTLWDRTKDKRLAQGILDKKFNGYSMGATIYQFVCSICGKVDNLDDKCCKHMKKKGTIWGKKRRLAFQNCTGTCYFETSAITQSSPADPSAYSDDVYL